MTTRNILQRASTIVHEHGRDAALEGNQADADKAYAVADELDKLAETAELRDELWAAAKAYAMALANPGEPSGNLTDASARLRVLCIEVAETERNEP